jgi:hypothetical protein
MAQTTRRGLSHAPAAADSVEPCLGRTCLQWRANGELAEPDASLILARLQAADPVLAELLAGGGDGREPRLA